MLVLKQGRGYTCLTLLVFLLQAFMLAAQGDSGMAPTESVLSFVERQVTLPGDKPGAAATLCLPSNRNGKLPTVVLVRTSGPEENNNSEIVSSMFAGLAHRLADAGIATLRYDPLPFSLSRAPDPTQLPLDQQIVNPAVAAMMYVSGLREVDSSAIFVLGHGLAGTMAPYIAAHYGHARGVILMAAAALPLEKSLAKSKKLALEKQGLSPQEISDIVAAQNQTLSDIRSGKMPPSRLYAGATVAYWRDRMNRDPARKARSLNIPILVLQGGNDAEVDEADYDRLQFVLSKKQGATTQFHLFPDLNHVFTSSRGIGSNQQNSIDPDAVRLIAHWVNSQASSASPKK